MAASSKPKNGFPAKTMRESEASIKRSFAERNDGVLFKQKSLAPWGEGYRERGLNINYLKSIT